MPESIIRPFVYRASAYSFVAALAEGLAWSLFPLGAQGLSGVLLVAAILGGPLLSALSLNWPRLLGYASLSTLFASLSVTLLALGTIDFTQPDVAGESGALVAGLSTLAFWPLIVIGILAGGALDSLATASDALQIARKRGFALVMGKNIQEQFVRSTGALVNFAIALSLSTLSIVVYAADTLGAAASLGWLVGTPIHLAILVLFAAICCLLVSVWADVARPTGKSEDGLYPADMIVMRSHAQRRFLRTLIALLPVMGFLGTVWGIKVALSYIPRELFFQDQSGDVSKAISDMTTSLKGIATAFETTLLGLVGSIAATLALAQIERAEAFRDAEEALDAGAGVG